jgi:hypothetical protein
VDAVAAPRHRRAGALEAKGRDIPAGGGGRGGRGGGPEEFRTLLRAPDDRDPRGFIIPADQPDFPTATKFVNALIKTGVVVHRATAPFAVAGRTIRPVRGS